jgi:hypothetical protein
MTQIARKCNLLLGIYQIDEIRIYIHPAVIDYILITLTIRYLLLNRLLTYEFANSMDEFIFSNIQFMVNRI